MGVSAFTITDERKQEIDFTESYLDSNQALVAPASVGSLTKEQLKYMADAIIASVAEMKAERGKK